MTLRVKIIAENGVFMMDKDCPKKAIGLLTKMIKYVRAHPEKFSKVPSPHKIQKKSHKGKRYE